MSVNSHSNQYGERRKRPEQLRSRETVERILAAAARIFADAGYSATTTNHVAEAAGVSIGSLYQYFPNKDALLAALEEQHLDLASTSFGMVAADWRAQHPNPRQWTESFVDWLIAANDSAVHVMIYDNAPALPLTRRIADALVDEMTGELAAHMRRWGVRGDRRLRAQVIVVAAVRLVHDLAVRAQRGDDRDRVRREIVRLVACSIPRA